MTPVFTDPILELAADVLGGAGYRTEPFQMDGDAQCLRAENALFLVTIATAPTLRELVRLNGSITSDLSRDLAEGTGPKRWDGYLVLLTEESISDVREATDLIYEMSYDTSFVRRIVRAGVSPELSTIQAVLRPFLPLEDRAVPGLGDALDLLGSELVQEGIPERIAKKAVRAFRDTESLRNV